MKLEAEAEAGLVAAVLHIDDGPGHDERMLTLVGARFSEAGLFPPDSDLADALGQCEAEARLHLLDASPGPI